MDHLSDAELELHPIGVIPEGPELTRIEEHLLGCQGCIDRSVNLEQFVTAATAASTIVAIQINDQLQALTSACRARSAEQLDGEYQRCAFRSLVNSLHAIAINPGATRIAVEDSMLLTSAPFRHHCIQSSGYLA
jgi:hypothetical protein